MHEDLHELPDPPDQPNAGAVIVSRAEWQALLDGTRERKAVLEKVLADVKAAKELAAREHETHEREERRLIQDVEREQQSHRRTAAALTVALNALEKLVAACAEYRRVDPSAVNYGPLWDSVREARELLLTAGRKVK